MHLKIRKLLSYFACRCFISSVRRWNKATEDAKWNHKHRHNSCPFCKCLPTAADDENAGIAQCGHLHQGWEQKHILWIVWCEVSKYGITSVGVCLVWVVLFCFVNEYLTGSGLTHKGMFSDIWVIGEVWSDSAFRCRCSICCTSHW